MLKVEDLYKTINEIFAIQEALGYNWPLYKIFGEI
jgi:hypothetical protein